MRTKIFKHAVIIMFLAGITVSCAENGSKEPEQPPVELGEEIQSTEFSLRGTSYYWYHITTAWNVKKNDTVIIINSDQDLREYIWEWSMMPDADFVSYPEIDFSTHSLVLARGVLTNPVSEISTKIFQQSTKYMLNVEITVINKEIITQRWCSAIVTQKLSENSLIELNVITSYDEDIVEIPFTRYNPWPWLTNVGCGWIKGIGEFPDRENIIMIHNHQELENYLLCIGDYPYPFFDFSEHVMLLANGQLPTTCGQIFTVFFKNRSGKYILNVNVQCGGGLAPSRWYNALLVPKSIAEEIIRLDVTTYEYGY